jgi:hypothetical protein
MAPRGSPRGASHGWETMAGDGDERDGGASVSDRAGARPGAGDEPGAIQWVEAKGDRAGCGVTGCLYGAAALFVLLLGAMVVIVLTRLWITPAVVQ